MTNKDRDISELQLAFKFVFDDLTQIRHSLQFARDVPGGGIEDTIWMMHSPETVFDAIDRVLDHLNAIIEVGSTKCETC